MPWKMFLIEESPFSRIYLRRYTHRKRTVGNTAIGFKDVEKPCPGRPGNSHEARAIAVDQIPTTPDQVCCSRGFEGDPRWPQKYANCPYVFEQDDDRMVDYEPLYQGAPDGKLYRLRESPIGATWWADWFGPNDPVFSGPDGKTWCVMLPGGMEWIIYGPSTVTAPDGTKSLTGPKWTVQGTVPEITAHPSINAVGYYHGYVTGGIITEDCEGRKYEGVPRTA